MANAQWKYLTYWVRVPWGVLFQVICIPQQFLDSSKRGHLILLEWDTRCVLSRLNSITILVITSGNRLNQRLYAAFLGCNTSRLEERGNAIDLWPWTGTLMWILHLARKSILGLNSHILWWFCCCCCCCCGFVGGRVVLYITITIINNAWLS